MRIISGTARGTKLNTLEGENTRPTLDRVKEPLFSIIQSKIKDSVVLDLFSGSGALALEAISRGAKKAILCDKSIDAISIIKKNIEKTHCIDKAEVIHRDYKECLNSIKEKIDMVFIDPPYKLNIAVDALKRIIEKNILTENAIVVIETDDEKREIEQINKMEQISIIDLRSYGRVKLIFLSQEKRG